MKQQKVITVSKRFTGIDQYHMNLDEITEEINRQGWEIKQIVSTTFKDGALNGQQYPVLVISLLIEKEE